MFRIYTYIFLSHQPQQSYTAPAQPKPTPSPVKTTTTTSSPKPLIPAQKTSSPPVMKPQFDQPPPKEIYTPGILISSYTILIKKAHAPASKEEKKKGLADIKSPAEWLKDKTKKKKA